MADMMHDYGGCNNIMYSPNPSNIVSLIQKELELVPYPLVLELLHALGTNYPSHHTTPFELLLAAITTELENKTRASPQTNHR